MKYVHSPIFCWVSVTFPAAPKALRGSSTRGGRFATFCSGCCPRWRPCLSPPGRAGGKWTVRIAMAQQSTDLGHDKGGNTLGGKLSLPFQNCVPLCPRVITSPIQGQSWKGSISRVGLGGRQHVLEGPHSASAHARGVLAAGRTSFWLLQE